MQKHGSKLHLGAEIAKQMSPIDVRMDDRAADFAPYFRSGAARGASVSPKSLNLRKT